MKYASTRRNNVDGGGSDSDGAPISFVSFQEAICSGYAPDGGLYVPETLPTLSKKDLKEWSRLSYPDLSFEILRLFISPKEVADEVLRGICATTLDGFEDPNHAVPIRKLGSVYVAELFHGPTFCFKDFGLGAVVSLLSYFSSQQNIPTTLLVATTGDTGPAAVQAVSRVNNPLVRILVHFPLGQISEFQKRQLTTVDSPCVRVVSFEGGGDDMDAPIKRILQSSSRGESNDGRVVGVNSYNIARPLMQMVHFVWTYLRVVEDVGLDPGNADVRVDMVVPTGAMGNIVGGYMAKKMGVPIGRLCAGTNINDIVYRVMHTGQFHRSNRMERTLSEAINIQLPYNFERLLYYLTDCNSTLVKEWMDTVDNTSKLDLDSTWLSRLQDEFASERVTDDAMCATIQSIKQDYDYTVDPHTAVAFSSAMSLGYNLRQQTSLVAILSTASPCKFQESMTVALGSEGWNDYVNTEYPEQAGRIMEMTQIEPIVYRKGEDWEALTRRIVDDFAKSR
jgi:threonine synthase